MEENIKEVVEEIKSANEDDLKKVVSNWMEQMRTDGLRIGARYMAAGGLAIIKKHTAKADVSRRDYERMTKELVEIFSKQLQTKQNDLEEEANDGTAETDSDTNS